MLSFLLAMACTTAPLVPKEQPVPEPLVVEDIENGTITFRTTPNEKKPGEFKLDKVKTPRGTRIRMTTDSVIIEATRLKICTNTHEDGRVLSRVIEIRLDKDGAWQMDSSRRGAVAPPPQPK